MNQNCIFCKIISGEIPAEKVYEDEWSIAFKDIHPVAPTHILVIPREHFASLNDTPRGSDIMTKLFSAVPTIAKKVGVAETGYRTVINTGKHAGQVVFHFHLHILAGRQLGAMG